MPKAIVAMVPIPISAGKQIAETYGYDQVVIMARRCYTTPEPHGEHVTTYGRTIEHCRVAAMMGDKLKQVAQWSGVDATTQKIADLEAIIAAQADEINNLKIEALEREEQLRDMGYEASEAAARSDLD